MNNKDIDFSKYNLTPHSEFEEHGLTPMPKTVDTLFGELPINAEDRKMLFDPMHPMSSQERRKNMLNTALGIPQGYINSMIGMVNLLPKVNIPKLNYAPKNEKSEGGQMIGDIASYFGPRGLAKLAGAPELIHNALNLSEKPITRNALSNIGALAEGTLFGASHAPEGEKMKNAAISGGTASAMDLATKMLSNKYPILSTLGRIGLGYGIGEIFGHPGYGAAISAIPQMRHLFKNPSELTLAENALRDINPQEVARSLKANAPLGTMPTPGEASSSYTVRGREGALRGNAGRIGEKLEEQAIDKQTYAVKKMLNDIYKPSQKTEAAISKAYKKADPMTLPQHEIDAIKADPIMREAFDDVRRMPGFKDMPENSYEYMSQVHRNLWKDYKAFSRSRDPTHGKIAYNINEARKAFNDFLKRNNPHYKEATRLAAPKYRREEVENKLNLHEEKLTAKNVYTRLLDTPKKYKDTKVLLKPYPKALKAVENMRKGWSQYANIKGGSQAEAQAKTRIDQARNFLNKVNDFLEANIGKKATEEQLKYIHSDIWPKGFELIENAKNQREAMKHTLSMISKMGLAYGLSDTQSDNLTNLITQEE